MLSHRQIVEPEISATMPRAKTSRRSSVRLKRERGIPNSAGNWQASAFTSHTTSGGKSRGPAPAWTLLQARRSFLPVTFSPFAHDGPRHSQGIGDLLIGASLGGQEDDRGPDHVSIR